MPFLKIITYNIGYASDQANNKAVVLDKAQIQNNLDKIIETLKGVKADIVCLQEVDLEAARSCNINQLKYINDALHFPHSDEIITWDNRYVPWPGLRPKFHFGKITSGQAILSHHPLQREEIVTFEKPRENPFWFNHFYPDRAVQKVTVDLGGEKISLWHLHLEAFRKKARLRQAQHLCKMLKEDSQADLVVGDFNSDSFCKLEKKASPEALQHLLKNSPLNNAEPQETLYTFPSWDPWKKIDHILYKKTKLQLESCGNEKFIASDHLPLWANFEI